MSSSVNSTPAAPAKPDKSDDRSEQIREVFTYWQATLNHPNSKLDDKRKKAIRARLAEGFTVENLKHAIDGCRASPFHQGGNERQQVYDDLTLICRDASKVEQFMSYLNRNGPTHRLAQFSPAAQQTILAGERILAELQAKGEL